MMLDTVSDDFLTRFFAVPKDPRTKDWLLVKHPSLIFTLIATYVYFVKIYGPRWMKSKNPYNVKTAILVYNASMVVVSGGFLWTIMNLTYFGGGYSLFCQGMRYDTDEKTLALLDVTWYLRLVRIADFLDTIFFVLRKKFGHISTLHVVHHALVVFDGWFWHRVGTDGQIVFIICLNTFVHVIMYGYYFLSCLGPQVQKYLWWKKYLTLLQIGQFIVAMIHGLIPVFVDCGYPRLLIVMAMPQGVLFLYLFFKFYFQAYIRDKSMGFRNVCNVQGNGYVEMNGKTKVS